MALPTNRQQIMRRAAERGHEVLFVETGRFLGTHLIRLLRGPRRRSLARRLFTGERVAHGIIVRKAQNLLPWSQRYRICGIVNGWVSARALSRHARRLPGPLVAWLYDPTATWAIGVWGSSLAAYDCVDDYAEQAAGVRNRKLVGEGDRRAARMSRIVFTTATPLYERHSRTNPNTHLVRNAGDFDHFAPAADRELARCDLRDLPRPVLGFAGNFLLGKVDFDLLEGLAASLETGTLVLAGPVPDPACEARVKATASRSNVLWIGQVEYGALASVIASFDVCLIPYLENVYTRSCFPLKLFEYLAAGKPVVATGLPELTGMEPDVTVVSGSLAVATAIAAAVKLTGPEDVARRQALAGENTWERRTSRLLDLIAAEIET